MPIVAPEIDMEDPEWHLKLLGAEDAWEKEPPQEGGKRKGSGITVLQLDTGYTLHPELLDPEPNNRYLWRLAEGFGGMRGPADDLEKWDYFPDDSTSILYLPLFPSHGTKTASVLMSAEGAPKSAPFGYDTNGKCVTGIAPEANLVPYRVTRSVWLNDLSDMALCLGIYWALGTFSASRLGVIQISLGRGAPIGTWTKPYVRRALLAARDAGVVVCAAAGQIPLCGNPVGGCKLSGPAYPARDSNVIGVAACNHDGSRYSNGFYGPGIDISAYGGDGIWVAETNREDPKYTVSGGNDGTSYATALVAGACAVWQAFHGREWLLKEYGPKLIFTLFRRTLSQSAIWIAGESVHDRGEGILNLKKLLEQKLERPDDIRDLDESQRKQAEGE